MALNRVSGRQKLSNSSRNRARLDEQTASILDNEVIQPLARLPFVDSIYLETDNDIYNIVVIAEQTSEDEMTQIWDIEQDVMEAHPKLALSIELIEHFGRALDRPHLLTAQPLYQSTH